MLIKGLDECVICFEKIKNSSNTYKPNFSIGRVCEKCNLVFSPEQIEVITHIFNTVRGIFEVTEDDNIIVKDVLFDNQSELKLHNKETFTIQSIFQKILLRAQVYSLKLNTFFLTNYQYSKEILKHPNCVICHKPITSHLNNGDPKSNKDNICEYCKLQFSEGEFLTMTSLFKKYGGFFNKLDSQKLSLKQILENLLSEIRNENDFSRMIELNEIALHHGLLLLKNKIYF
ncbi:hypothetical protein LCGC14_0933190 [marine sediment metagenome]|uniref:Uncharacterized protein n=1 Tax=marine sediment metagenome TaxID=412755 RepID=A0A0F9NRW4_9ZZZZ